MVSLADFQPRAHANALAAHDHQPARVGKLAQQEDLRRTPGWDLAGGQPGRDNPRLVEHDDVARAQVFRQIAERAVLDGPGSALQHQHARGIAWLGGRLGDSAGRQMVVEIRESHGRSVVDEADDDVQSQRE